MKVIPMLDQTSAEIATRAITCISENVECQQRFGDCKQLFSNLQDTADVNSTKWHRSYGNGACDTMTPEQLGLSNRPLIAMDLLLAATSASIYASNEGWLSIVDEVSSKLIECEQINNKANADRMTAEWERNTLLNIIAANE
jgi:hypothetical protein